MKCPYCSNDHPDGAKFCPVTGVEIIYSNVSLNIQTGTKLCPNCHLPIKDHWIHCPNCSSELKIRNYPHKNIKRKTKDRSVLIIWFVVIFFGLLALIVIAGILLNHFDLLPGTLSYKYQDQPEESSTFTKELDDEGSAEIDQERDIVEIENGLQQDEHSVTNQNSTITEQTTEFMLFQTATLTPSSAILNTITPTQTLTPTFSEKWEACPGLYLSQLRAGDNAMVAEDPPLANRVRSNAGASYSIIGYIQPGEKIKILEGPKCNDNWIWWKIISDETGLTGWTAEGDDEDYWLFPVP